MGEDRLTVRGVEGLLAKKTRWNNLIHAVTPFAILQALFCCTILQKSVASPRVFQTVEHSASLLKLVQNNGSMLDVHNISNDESGPVSLDINVNLDDISGYAFLMFRGVPEEFKFTNGFRVKKSWVVSLRDLEELQLVPPEGYVGQFELTVLLVRERNETVESHKMLVSLGQGESTTYAKNTRTNNDDELLTSAIPIVVPEEKDVESPSLIGQPETGIDIPAKLLVSQDQEQKLLERAAKLVEVGEISSARLMFEHLAKKGSGLGAMALAQTYDPIYFQAMKTLGGISADVEKARKWYRIAAELGREEANTRLSVLSRN